MVVFKYIMHILIIIYKMIESAYAGITLSCLLSCLYNYLYYGVFKFNFFFEYKYLFNLEWYLLLQKWYYVSKISLFPCIHLYYILVLQWTSLKVFIKFCLYVFMTVEKNQFWCTHTVSFFFANLSFHLFSLMTNHA